MQDETPAMTDKYEALRKAATAVIHEGGTGWFDARQTLHEEITGEIEPELSPVPEADMCHIAAAMPQAILELLAERDALREAAAKALHALEQLDGSDTETEDATIYVSDEIDALRAALGQEDEMEITRTTECLFRPLAHDKDTR